MKAKTFRAIQSSVDHARAKHSWQSRTDDDKYRIAEREMNEMGVAMLKGDTRAVRAEALDCIAVLIRIAEGE